PPSTEKEMTSTITRAIHRFLYDIAGCISWEISTWIDDTYRGTICYTQSQHATERSWTSHCHRLNLVDPWRPADDFCHRKSQAGFLGGGSTEVPILHLGVRLPGLSDPRLPRVYSALRHRGYPAEAAM